MSDSDVPEFELQREQRIAYNKLRLQELGVFKARDELLESLPLQKKPQSRRKRVKRASTPLDRSSYQRRCNLRGIDYREPSSPVVSARAKVAKRLRSLFTTSMPSSKSSTAGDWRSGLSKAGFPGDEVEKLATYFEKEYANPGELRPALSSVDDLRSALEDDLKIPKIGWFRYRKKLADVLGLELPGEPS